MSLINGVPKIYSLYPYLHPHIYTTNSMICLDSLDINKYEI